MNGLESFRNYIRSLSVLSNVTSSSSVPCTEIKATPVFGIPVEGRNTEKVIEMYCVDNHFFDTYGISISAGDNFAPTMWEDTSNIIINEAALPYFGFEDAAGTVVKGVVRDFNQQIMKELPRPIAWFAMNKWLRNYAIKIELSWWIFALAGIIACIIALVTVSWQSWRAANLNPAEALRDE